MRYETTVNIAVDRRGKDYRLEFDFEVVKTPVPPESCVQVVDVRRTSHILPFTGCRLDGEWFWDICPESLSRQLDREMIEAWNEANSPEEGQEG